jgi:hypothetical protein
MAQWSMAICSVAVRAWLYRHRAPVSGTVTLDTRCDYPVPLSGAAST